MDKIAISSVIYKKPNQVSSVQYPEENPTKLIITTVIDFSPNGLLSCLPCFLLWNFMDSSFLKKQQCHLLRDKQTQEPLG